MKRPAFAALTTALAVAAAGAASDSRSAPARPALLARALDQGPPGPAYVDGEVVVQFRDGVPEREMERALQRAGADRARRSAFGPRVVARLGAGSVEDALRMLRATEGVRYAEPNLRAYAFQRPGHFQPNDSFYDFQWHLRMIDAERTWGIQRGDASVVVAVLDTGIAFEDFGPFRKAPDFAGTTFVPGADLVENDGHPNDDEGHGTHVAGTIAQSTNNSLGVAGLAFQTALMPVKVLGADGSGGFFQIAEGVDFAVENGAKVINLSLGTSECGARSTTMAEAVNRAVAAGVTVVAAAGNEGDTTACVKFPASLPNVIAVGAVDGRKARASYSDFGPELDVVAPAGDNADITGVDDQPDGFLDGVLQQSLDPDALEVGRFDQFAFLFAIGTSSAAPQVSALAALLYHQGITQPEAIQSAIESTAEDLGAAGRDDQFGHGLIRPAAALTGLGLNR